MANTCPLSHSSSLLICDDLGDFKTYEQKLYGIFTSLYEQGCIVYNGLSVKMKHYPPDYGPYSGFYHLTCENYEHTQDETDRVPDLRRCERLTWPKTIIDQCSIACPSLLIWENTRHGKNNILLFCPQLDYLVVLSKRNDYLLLTTAYPIQYKNRKDRLLQEYHNYTKQTTHSA